MNRNKQLDYLIEYLSPMTAIPHNVEDKWRMFRSLVNLREPQHMNDDFLQIQDEMLQSLITEKGIIYADDLQQICDNIYLWQGDITTLKVDAIVNAANSGMLGCFVPCHGCIDNAIHTYAGVQLRLECADIMKKQGHAEQTGQAKITAAYNLPCKYILHTVGAIVNHYVTDDNRRQLASCYKSCLELTDEHKIKNIAFCCISTGEFRFPNEEAAVIAVNTVKQFIAERQSKVKVIFNVYKGIDYEIYKRLLETDM